MPAINSGKVLVTGASGYIAVWVAKTLLDGGFAVRGTVRSHAKGALLKEIFKTYRERFEYVIVEDITKEDAFDEAVKGVDAIAHTASPFRAEACDDVEDLIISAVRGATGVLDSAQKYGDEVKRIVLTSSCTAVTPPSMEALTVDETNWNEDSVREVRQQGRNANPVQKYRASKTSAERAAWDWYEKHKGKIKWDMVVLNPSLVFGPWLHKVEKVEDLSPSLLFYYWNVLKGRMSNELLGSTGTSYVDVRDIAEAHTLAFVRPAAGGERIIVSSSPFKWQDLILVAHRLEDKVPPGDTSYEPSIAKHIQYITEKEERLLGVTYHSLEETTSHMLHEFKCRGWL